MATIDSLNVVLDYVFNEKNIKKFNSAVKKTTALIKKLALAVLGAVTAFAIFATITAKSIITQTRFAKAIGASVEGIRALDKVSKQLTGESGTAQGMLETFDGISNALKAGEAPSENFLRGLNAVGVSLEQFQKLSPEDRLLAIAEGFQTLSEDGQDVATHLLGFDTAARRLANTLNRADFEETLAGLTPVDADALEQTAREQAKFTQSISELSAKAINAVLPTINDLLTRFENFLPTINKVANDVFNLVQNVTEQITNFIDDIFNDLTGAVDSLGDLLDFVTPDFLKTKGASDDQAFLQTVGAPALAAGGAGGGSFTQTNNIQIDVTGTSDPVATGNAAVDRATSTIAEAGRNAQVEDTV